MNAETGRKFHFIRVIASGGFGTVYLAKELHADGFSRVVAVKLLHPKWSENEEIASRMRDEARLLGQIRHRHIVDVRDLTRIDGRVAVIMEYLEAVDMKEVIHAAVASGTPIPIRVCLEICADAASALDAAYNRPPYAGEKPLRVIHRDIKPSNIMVDDQGVTKVLDFGVARADFQGRESETQELSFGSVEYMPPERLFFEPESPASDIYSLGTTLYELIALDKFGKAKLRPNLHDQHVDARLDAVFAEHPVGEDRVRDEIDLLLTEMLSFDEADRPSAADCAVRMRELAKQIVDEPTLQVWAQATIPPLVAASHAQASLPDDLVDRVMEEDSKGFERIRPTPLALEEPVVASSADRAFDALKEETLAGLTPPPASRSASPGPRGLAVPPPPPRRSPPAGARTAAAAPSPAGDTAVAQAPSRPASPRQRSRVESARTPPAPPPPQPGRGRPTSQRRPPPPGTAVMAPPARPVAPPTPPRPARGRGVSLLVGGVVIGLFVVFLVAVGLFVWVVAFRDPVPAPPVAEVAPAPAVPAPTVTSGPAARFRSGLSGTTKLTVRCDGGDAEGTDSAVVAGTEIGACTVTAMDASRQRLTAVVEDVTPGEYLCFEGGERACR